MSSTEFAVTLKYRPYGFKKLRDPVMIVQAAGIPTKHTSYASAYLKNPLVKKYQK